MQDIVGTNNDITNTGNMFAARKYRHFTGKSRSADETDGVFVRAIFPAVRVVIVGAAQNTAADTHGR